MARVHSMCVFFFTLLVICANAHVEDICINPPGPNPTDGVSNAFSIASSLGCDYANRSIACQMAILKQSGNTFKDTSQCRGYVHFNVVYVIAAALGFTQDDAHFLAAFSQAIDFQQFRAVNACGKDMATRYWTPRMRGLVRTDTYGGGSLRHLGSPFIGELDAKPFPDNITHGSGPVLTFQDKQYSGKAVPCVVKPDYAESFASYAKTCAGLDPDLTDMYYEGALSGAKQWAFGQSSLLCAGGFTIWDEDRQSPFTGKACPAQNSSTLATVNTGTNFSGPIPLTGGDMPLGEQLIHYECLPNCNATNATDFKRIQEVYAPDFGLYLYNQSQQTPEGYASYANGQPVHELIARLGIFLHWVQDRSSHWYGMDAPGAGVAIYRDTPTVYRPYVYMDQQFYINKHAETHYWEQGMRTEIAPGTYAALVSTFNVLQAFQAKFATSPSHAHLFHARAHEAHVPVKDLFAELVGTPSHPGVLVEIAMEQDAHTRLARLIDELERRELPPMPGFETMCQA